MTEEETREAMLTATLEHARAVGVMIAVVSTPLVFWLDSYVISRARNGEEVLGFDKGYAFVVSLTFIALSLIVGGPRMARFYQRLITRPKDAGYWLMGIAVVSPGLIAYYWLHDRIDAVLSAGGSP